MPRTADERSSSPTHASPRATWLEIIKRWSPAFLPPLVGILLLLLSLFFTSQDGLPGTPSVSPTVLIELLAIYLVLGMVWGFALYLEAELLRWLLIVLGGVGSYLVVTASVYWGVTGGVILVALFAALSAWYCRRHVHDVPAGSAAVTTLAGSYLRTLSPGVWVLAPGERVHTTLEMRDQTILCGPAEVRLPGEESRHIIAHAAAVIGFRVTAASAHGLALAPADWLREVHDVAAATLEQSLDEWARLPQNASAESPAEQLAAIYKRDLDERAGQLGLRGITVHMQDVELSEEDELAQTDGAYAYQAPAERNATPQGDTPPGTTTTPLPASRSAPSLREVSVAESVAPPPLPDALDPDVLTKAYQAVADRRITDPATIRAIADAFVTIARDPVRAAEVEFDAGSAARILMGHAAKLERRRRR